ncbi:MAG: site-2 protease family protein [Aggregatilineales bacterium]
MSRAIVLLVAMAVHEFAHAYIAYRMGDPTAKEQGRMTLDPRANIYWPGFIIGVFIGFAVLGSAPVNPYRMRDSRWGMFWAVLAGPVSNLLLAILFALPVRLGLVPFDPFGTIAGGLLPSLGGLFFEMIWLNILLFVFNLLPLAPLDGWTVMLSALPAGPAIWWERHRQTTTYVLFGLIALSFLSPRLEAIHPLLGYANVLGWLIGDPSASILGLLLGF